MHMKYARGIIMPSWLVPWQVIKVWLPEALRIRNAAQVYAITLYVEGGRAARELGVRKRGGFFQDAGTEEYADALVDGAFSKLIQVQLVRNVDGDTFFGVSYKYEIYEM